MYQLFGIIRPPEGVRDFGTSPAEGIGRLIQLFFNILIIAGGIYAVFNFILAGYAFLSAGDNPKGMETAWAKIYQTIIGLVFLVGSFLLSAVVGLLIFGRADALLNPTLTVPGAIPY